MVYLDEPPGGKFLLGGVVGSAKEHQACARSQERRQRLHVHADGSEDDDVEHLGGEILE